jgi:predicted ribosomally synthesized peptide with SipW-like signal peptide
MSGRRRAATTRAPGRVRAVLALGMLLGFSSVGTAASWTDAAEITGATFTSGTIDLQVNDLQSVTTTTLSMTGMVPTATAADVLRVRNAGSATFTYTISGGLGGTDGGAFATANALLLSVYANGSRTGTGNTAVCTGGTALVTNQSLTSGSTATIVGTAQGPVAAGGQGPPLCFQVTFASAASSALQGKAATATFTFTATSTP